MAGLRIGRFSLALGVVLLAAGCQPGTSPFEHGAEATSNANELPISSEGRLAEGGDRDVEAPDVFRMTDESLWDGRPSLGGVWVAHASAKDPERVIIRNTANGKSVVGALFRREEANPGPSLQLSSDAAGALEILAGQPTTIEVVALRRDKPAEAEPLSDEVIAAQEAAEDVVPSEETAASDSADGAVDPIAVAAAAAIDEAEGVVPADGATGDIAGATPAAPEVNAKGCPLFQRKKCLAERQAAAAAAAAIGAGAVDGAEDTGSVETATEVAAAPLAEGEAAPLDALAVETPATPEVNAKGCPLFQRKKCLAERQAAAAAAAGLSGAVAEGTNDAALATEVPAEVDGLPAADALAVEAPLEPPVAPAKKCGIFNRKKCLAEQEAAAAAAGAVAAEGAVPVSADTSVDAAITSEAIPASPVAAGTLKRAYVQVGIFSQADNAQRAADELRAAGLLASVKTDESNGKTFWRVVVGPAASTGERDGFAAKVKDMGYPDAYPVSG